MTDQWRNRMGGQAASAPVATPQADPERKYEALKLGKNGIRSVVRFRIEFLDGRIDLLPYAYIGRFLYDGSIVFACEGEMYKLGGDALDKLLEPLQDEKVDTLRQFDDQRHDKPVAGEPVIRTIERKRLQG